MSGPDDPLSPYARRLQEQLHPDLVAAELERARVREQIREYQDLARELQFLHESGRSSFDAKVPIGSDAAVRAHVADASKVLIQTGLQFWAECTAEEAQPFIAAQVAFLERRAARSSAKVATIRAHVRLTEQAMAELAASLSPT